MYKRLTADEFIEKIRSAPEWALQYNNWGELELFVRESEQIKMFMGPDPLDIDYAEYERFVIKLEEVTHSKRLTADEFMHVGDKSEGEEMNIINEKVIGDAIATLPEPSFIRIPSARVTVPFFRGTRTFKIVKKGPARAKVKFLDARKKRLVTLDLTPVGEKVYAGYEITLIIPPGPFWTAIEAS
jgi:hypothetical protein